MDFASLKDQVSNLTLYDLKAGVRKVQNGKLKGSVAIEGPWLMRFSSRHELYGNGSEGQRSYQ